MKKLNLIPKLLILVVFAASCKKITKHTSKASKHNNNNEYTEQVRKTASSFHKNFSDGNYDKNGPLVTKNIYVNSNNVIIVGRDKFVTRIKRYHTPFPDLQLKDRVVLVEGNKAALWYVLQGEQKGPYGKIPASHNKVNVYSAEFFTMDKNAKMKELLTITQLDLLVKQIKGEVKVNNYEEVKLLPIDKTQAANKNMYKKNIEAYASNFNTRDFETLKTLFTKNVKVNWNGKIGTGMQAVMDGLNIYTTQLPDLTLHIDRNIVEGNRGAAAFTMNGTFNKKPVMARQGAHFTFNQSGKITSIVVISNENDIKKQLK